MRILVSNNLDIVYIHDFFKNALVYGTKEHERSHFISTNVKKLVGTLPCGSENSMEADIILNPLKRNSFSSFLARFLLFYRFLRLQASYQTHRIPCS